MRIVLICPEEPGYQPLAAHAYPLGPAYVSASLKRAGYEVHCVNGYHIKGFQTYEEKFREIAASLAGKGVDIVAVGGYSYMYRRIEEILAAGRKVFPEAGILLGGKIVECMPEKILRALDADYGILGEGEIATVELLRALESGTDPRAVAGVALWDRDTDEVFVSDKPCYPEDLDALPFPDREGFDFAEYLRRQTPDTTDQGYSQLDDKKWLTMSTSRSCPFQCTFCFHLPGVPVRRRSLENCFAEIDAAVRDYGINFVSFHDDILFDKNEPERVAALCEGMKRRGLKWSCSLRANAITDEFLSLLESSGCVSICFGIENISTTLLRSMKKAITFPLIEKAVSVIRKYKIDLAAAILVFDRRETWDTFAENVSWWLRNRDLGMIFIHILSCPNSAMYLHAKEKGIVKDEIEYIGANNLNAMALNATELPENEFIDMRSKMRELNSVAAYYPGILKTAAFAGKDEYGRERHRVEAVCPHCCNFNVYPRLHVEVYGKCRTPFNQDHSIQVWCKDCNRRYHLPNPAITSRYHTFGKRLYVTHYPPARLLGHYLQRGGTMEELCEDWPALLTEFEKNPELAALSAFPEENL